MVHSRQLSVCTLFFATKTYPGARKALISEFGGQIAGDDGAQHGAKVRGAFGAEAAIKPRLRPFPSLAPGEQAPFAGFGEVEFLGAPVAGGYFDLDQTVALERQSIAAERGAVHDHLFGQGIDRHGTKPLELGQNRKLRDMQSDGRQELVEELRHVPYRRANDKTIAVFLLERGIERHL